MARNFNQTNFPFLKSLGRDYSIPLFAADVFALDGWKDTEEQKLQRKIHKQWYTDYKDKMSENIYIFNDIVYKRYNIKDMFNNKKLLEDSYEDSGIIYNDFYDDIAMMYTIKLHSDEYVRHQAALGIETDNIELRMMLVLINPKQYRVQTVFLFSALSLMHINNDDGYCDQTCLNKNRNNISVTAVQNAIERVNSYKKIILIMTAAKLSGDIKMIPMIHGESNSCGVVFPFINYSGRNMYYIKEIKSNSMKKEEQVVIKKMNHSTIYTGGGVFKYEMIHTPIDYTLGLNGECSEDDDLNGLNKIFRPVKKDSDTYIQLSLHFTDDGPYFIGGIIVPVTCDMEMQLHKVYVVRCNNNGNTYFLSNNLQALSLFEN